MTICCRQLWNIVSKDLYKSKWNMFHYNAWIQTMNKLEWMEFTQCQPLPLPVSWSWFSMLNPNHLWMKETKTEISLLWMCMPCYLFLAARTMNYLRKQCMKQKVSIFWFPIFIYSVRCSLRIHRTYHCKYYLWEQWACPVHIMCNTPFSRLKNFIK